ncbi:MAG: DUF5658 family protein [Firmicutes bacterium]|nr:DUF5658 family protein [Bacillota bacterium]
MRLARETWSLLVIGLADLVSTTFLLRSGLVREANPVMAWYLVHFGAWAFCAAKVTMLVCPLVILEWVRRVKPFLGIWALRAALAGYLILYLGIVWRLNEAHIERTIGVHFDRISQRWQQRTEPVAPGRLPRKPAAIPVDREDILS